MLDKTKHAGQRIFDRSRAVLINFAAHSNGIGHIAPDRHPGFFEFAEEKRFVGGLWEEGVDRFEMSAGHRENVGRAIDEGGGERLAPQPANIDAFLFANVDRMQAWRLSTNSVDAGRSDFDVFAVPNEAAEEAFSHGAAADIAGADKEDAFHDDETGAHAGSAN